MNNLYLWKCYKPIAKGINIICNASCTVKVCVRTCACAEHLGEFEFSCETVSKQTFSCVRILCQREIGNVCPEARVNFFPYEIVVFATHLQLYNNKKTT